MAGIRARRRPRRKSINFRRLGWVLEREAALAILWPHYIGTPNEKAAREEVSTARPDALHRGTRLVLAKLVTVGPPRNPLPPSTSATPTLPGI